MIKSALFDIDGVLTDGRVLVNSKGEEFKSIVFDDIDAIFHLKRKGIKIGFITAENTPFCQYVKRRFMPDFMVCGCRDKLSAFKQLEKRYKLSKTSTLFVGDSAKDIELLRYCKYSFAPMDSDVSVKRAAGMILKSKRGEGVIKEAVDVVTASCRGRILKRRMNK